MYRSNKFKALALPCVVSSWFTSDVFAKLDTGDQATDPVTFSFAFFGATNADELRTFASSHKLGWNDFISPLNISLPGYRQLMTHELDLRLAALRAMF